MSEAISISEALDAYLAIYATRIHPNTLVLQRIYLKHHFLGWMTDRLVFDLRAVTRQHIEEYNLFLTTAEYRWRGGVRKIAATSRAERFASVRRFFTWAVSTRLLLVDPVCTITGPRGRRWQPNNVLSEAEMALLLDVPDTETPKGMRDRAILELLYSSGLRRAEIVALDLNDVDLTDCIVFVRCGKGAKQRVVPIGESAVEALRRYLTFARPLFLFFPGAKALFLISASCGGRGRRLGYGAVFSVVKQTARKAGITKRVTPHTLRHSVATHLLRAGADVRYVQELLGHNRIDTTECYTHLDVTDLRVAHARSHPRGREGREKQTSRVSNFDGGK